MKITANNPNRKSWLTVETDSDFPIQNIPFGVFLTKDDITTIGTRIGNYAIDLAALQQLGYFEGIPLTDDIFMQDSLNDFIADGQTTWRLVRNRIADIFDAENKKLKDHAAHREVVIFDINEIEMLLPVVIGDYTDFYSSKDHATNVGTMFRDPENALLPNWVHIPTVVSDQGYKLSKQTAAPALDTNRAAQQLCDALSGLGLPVEGALKRAAVRDIWQYAIEHWQPKVLLNKQITTLD